jgi:hypothetical protein
MEKRMFDAIDGTSTIRHIAEEAGPGAPTLAQSDMARRFFELLWCRGQIVRHVAPFHG